MFPTNNFTLPARTISPTILSITNRVYLINDRTLLVPDTGNGPLSASFSLSDNSVFILSFKTLYMIHFHKTVVTLFEISGRISSKIDDFSLATVVPRNRYMM